jgi:hypothetical protein
MLTLPLVTAIVTTYFIVRFNELEAEPAPVETSERPPQRRR